MAGLMVLACCVIGSINEEHSVWGQISNIAVFVCKRKENTKEKKEKHQNAKNKNLYVKQKKRQGFVFLLPILFLVGRKKRRF